MLLPRPRWLQAGDRTGDPEGVLARLAFVIDDFTRVLLHHPTHNGAFFNRAIAYQNRGGILKEQGKLREAAEAEQQSERPFSFAVIWINYFPKFQYSPSLPC